MLRKLILLLFMVCLVSLPAQAARTDGRTGEAVCTRLDTAPAGSRVNLETFVPDPGCWLQASTREVNNRNLYKVTATIAKFIVIASLLIAALKSVTAGSPTIFLKALVIGIVVFYSADTYDRKSGLGWTVASAAMEAWQTVYLESSRVGQQMLDDRVLAQVEQLDVEFQKYLSGSLVIQSITRNSGLRGDPTDPVSLETAWQDVQKEKTFSPFLGKGGTSVAYFLLLGLFSVFAALVYSSGMMVLLTVLILPIVMALSTLGSARLIKATAVIWITNVITILILPIFMAILISTTLQAPIRTLKDNLSYNAQLASEAADKIKSELDACSGVFFVNCRFTAFADNFLQGWENSFLGISVGVIAVLVIFSISMTQLRRIPAAVDRILGGMGGGESSGVKTDFADKPRLRSRVTTGSGTTNKVTTQTASVAASGPAGGRSGGGTVTQVPKGPSLPPGGPAPSPRVILNNALPAPGRKP